MWNVVPAIFKSTKVHKNEIIGREDLWTMFESELRIY